MDYYRTLLGGEPEDPVLQLSSPFPSGKSGGADSRPHPNPFQGPGGITGGRGGGDWNFGAAAGAATTSSIFPRINISTPRSRNFRFAFRQSGAGPASRHERPERDAFLAAFSVEHGETLVGFAVLGGIFGEGIDLVGERLIGAVIVGVGCRSCASNET
jgi:hypothetical protein